MNERYQQGLKKLQEIEGNAADEALLSLKEVSPDLARYCVEFPLGDIYSREGIDIKSREIAAIAALTALGNASLQLKIHVKAALRVKCTETEIKETIMQTAIFAGFPAAINGMFIAKEAFKEYQCET